METFQTKEKEKIFLIPTKNNIRIINQKEVMYVRADSNYSVFIMDDNSEWVICQTLRCIEKELEQTSFLRCHKSYLVNLSKIREISRLIPELVLVDNVRLPISRRKRKCFVNALYLISKTTIKSIRNTVYS